MKNYSLFIIPIISMIFFNACSVKHSALVDTPNGVTLYQIDKQKASNLAYKAVEMTIDSQTIGALKDEMGYFATERVLLDEQTYTVKLIPIKGTRIKDNTYTEGFSFDVLSDGTLFHGPSVTKELFKNTIQLFNETGTGVKVTNVLPRQIKLSQTSSITVKNKQDMPNTSNEYKKLKKLKKMYEDGLIDDNDYKKKKTDILNRM